MILKKIIISAFAMCFLTGCLQNVAFLGPALTVASTGSVYQAGLSYGSSQVIKKKKLWKMKAKKSSLLW